MTSLLDLDYDGRKQFVFDRLRTVPEWADVCTLSDFSMEQNKGLYVLYRLLFRRTYEYHLSGVQEQMS